jgi:hypothetical protein
MKIRGNPRLKREDFAAVRANPGDVVARHSPEVLLHTCLTDPKSAGTIPAETAALFAADTILFRSFSRIHLFPSAARHPQAASEFSQVSIGSADYRLSGKLLQSAPHQQCFHLGFGAAELDVLGHHIVAAAREQVLAERCRQFAVEQTGFLECLKRIRIQHFGLNVAVVTRRIAGAVKNMAEVGTLIA